MLKKRRFVPFHKVDEEQRMVWGRATDETVDSESDVIDYGATKAAVAEWTQWRNIREMHQPSAVGVAVEITLDDAAKALDLGVKVVDDEAWRKVKGGVYKGFSVAGLVFDVVMTKLDGQDIRRITRYALTEISLVDRPANPSARFSMLKRDASRLSKFDLEERAMQVREAFYAEHQAEIDDDKADFYCQTVETDPDRVIVAAGGKLYEYAYTLGATGITFGEPSEVEIRYIPTQGAATEEAATEEAPAEAEAETAGEEDEMALAVVVGDLLKVQIAPVATSMDTLAKRVAALETASETLAGLAKRVAALEAQPVATAPVVRVLPVANNASQPADEVAVLDRMIEATANPLAKEALGHERALVLLKRGTSPQITGGK